MEDSYFMPEITLKYNPGNFPSIEIGSSSDVAQLLRNHIFNEDTIGLSEELIFLYANRAGRTVGWHRHTSGHSSECLYDPKLVFATALVLGAHGIIMAHNHPSGRLVASEADRRTTEKLIAAGKILQLKILDHIILAPQGQYLSMADEGILIFNK